MVNHPFLILNISFGKLRLFFVRTKKLISFVVGNAVFKSNKIIDIPQRQLQTIFALLPGNKICLILRIEFSKLFCRNIHHPFDLTKIQIPLQHYCIRNESKRLCELCRINAVFGMKIHHIRSCNIGRYVAPCLFRKEIIHTPKVISARAFHCFVHIPRTTVVCSNRKRPIVVDFMEVFQILGSSFRRFNRVHSVVNNRINPQIVHFSRCIHKLPKTRSTYS